MKNILLGVVGGFTIIYMTIIGLTIFGIQSRENELQNCLSMILLDELEQHYVPEIFRGDDYQCAERDMIAQEIQSELERRIQSDTDFSVDILACDMDKGLLSVRVKEKYLLPNGAGREWSFTKTAIME